jgi:L-histidine N-alpha-methyltransferase
MSNSKFKIINRLKTISREEELAAIGKDLESPPRSIPSIYFYDARGSLLFEEICRLPEYYQTRTELDIIRGIAPEVINGRKIEIIELGAGESLKIRTLMDNSHMKDFSSVSYLPVDVSESALKQSASRLVSDYDGIEICALMADFTKKMQIPFNGFPKVFFFFGSTIGNLHRREAVELLGNISAMMSPEDRFLVGFDRIKSSRTLHEAYNDSRGITAEFNKNILNVINRKTGADFNPNDFEHEAFFNAGRSRIEMHLRARRDMNIRLTANDMNINIRKGERIHTENSHKYSAEGIRQLASESGLRIGRIHSDDKEWFSLAEFTV